jgi:beta-lactamase superfamily II metal-dependent hydrolase
MHVTRKKVLFATILLVAISAACADSVSSASTPLAPTAPALAVSPVAGQLVINEFLADPNAVTDANGEWFEIYNRGTSAVNLQNFRIASANDAVHTITASVSVPAGGYVVLGRNAASSTNGGVTVAYAYGTTITLANASDWLALRDANGATVDSVSYTSTTAGAAWGVKDASLDNTVVGSSNWQLQTSTFGLGDRGTPNKANDGAAGGGGGGGGGTAQPLTVRFLDVGQGDATYITNGTSKVIIDGGPDTLRFGRLLDSLGLNGQTIDLVVLSHEHYDHHSGLLELFKSSRNITVRYFEENQNAYANTQLQRLRDSISARVTRGTLIYRDTDDPCANGSAICTFSLNGGAKIHILKPNPAGTSPNNRSAVEKIVGPDSASFTMWLAGDAEQEEIAWFLGAAGYATNPGMKVSVLKADHHGSCNGVTNAYVDATNPSWVFAGVGATNTYGHMHTQAKNLYTAHGKPWYRTDGNGTVVVSTPGTPGSGYTVNVQKGASSMSGTADKTSTQAQCNPVP